MKTHADRKRIIEDFIRLTGIDSVSYHERRMADALKEELQKLGFEVVEDDAGDHYSSEAGNVYGLLRGQAGKVPILLSVHMDTVQPGTGKSAEVSRDGIITGNGTAVLGADDVCGIVEILEAVRIIQEQGAEHRSIEVLFTVAEEVYGQGAKVFDFSRVISEDAYVFDMSGPAGAAARKAPSIISFRASLKGRAAHAGFAPQNGVNAIAAAASAVSRIKQGRISENMTLNIGTISGGKADNIVSEKCLCTGEARGFDHEEALREVQNVGEIFREEAERAGAELEFDYDVKIRAYEVSEDERVCRRFRNACIRTGLEGELKFTHGGSDNNIFMEKGMTGIVVSCGMYNTHSTDEYASVKDMEDTAELIAALISDDE